VRGLEVDPAVVQRHVGGVDDDAVGVVAHLEHAGHGVDPPDLGTHDPAQVGRLGLDGVQQRAPLLDDQAGLLEHLAGETLAGVFALGHLDDTTRRRPVRRAVPSLVAHEEDAFVGLDDRACDEPLPHGTSVADPGEDQSARRSSSCRSITRDSRSSATWARRSPSY
jgi:hypothetical protein